MKYLSMLMVLGFIYPVVAKADDAQVPAEFQQQIISAMKEAAREEFDWPPFFGPI